jgi:hypothetical protein
MRILRSNFFSLKIKLRELHDSFLKLVGISSHTYYKHMHGIKIFQVHVIQY